MRAKGDDMRGRGVCGWRKTGCELGIKSVRQDRLRCAEREVTSAAVTAGYYSRLGIHIS